MAVALAGVLTLTGCNSPDEQLPDRGGAQVVPDVHATPEALAPTETPSAEALRIRVRNVGQQTLEHVVMKFPSDTVECGDLAAGESSDFSVVQTAYRYAFVSAVVDGEERTLQPIDYVGEEPLEPGAYTFELRAISRGGMKRLDLSLVTHGQ